MEISQDGQNVKIKNKEADIAGNPTWGGLPALPQSMWLFYWGAIIRHD